jgi:hypothetical protein
MRLRQLCMMINENARFQYTLGDNVRTPLAPANLVEQTSEATADLQAQFVRSYFELWHALEFFNRARSDGSLALTQERCFKLKTLVDGELGIADR